MRSTPLYTAVRRSWHASGYLLLGVFIGWICYVSVALVGASLLFAIAVIGLPTWPEAVKLLRRGAEFERQRAAAYLGVECPPQRMLPADGTLSERVRDTFRDPGTWRTCLWLVVHTLVTQAFGYLAMILWPLGLLVDSAALPLIGRYDRRQEDEYGMPVPDRGGLLLRWHPFLARLSATWTLRLLAPAKSAALDERIAELTESRAGAVEAHGAELRRIERDLHDGAQARIVALSLRIGLAKQLLDHDPAAAKLRLEEAQDGAEQALAELRHVVRGIHPPVLTDRGLTGAVRALAADVSVPVDVDLTDLDETRRMPAAIEAAAYFVLAEALTNISKHSGATAATVRVARAGRTLRVTIGDDGHGGADDGAGSGLVGIRRRVAALDGTTRISSPAGGPTEIEVELPCGS